MPVKIVFITYHLLVGGAERQLYYLIRELDKSKYSVWVIPLREGDQLRPQFEAAGATVVPFLKRRAIDIRMLFQLTRFLRRLDPDVVHCQMFTANVWGRIAAVIAGCKRIIVSERNSNDLWRTRLHFAVERTLNKYATVYLGNSKRVCRYCEENLRLPQDTYRLMHNGVDTQEFRPATVRPVHEALVVGTVANIAPRKDLGTFLRMAAIVRSQFPGTLFRIIGQDGPLKAELLQLRDDLGLSDAVKFSSESENVKSVYHTFDVFVLSSAHEGFANAIVEAMASGLPVVATDVGGAPEVIEEQVTGFIVPPHNPVLLADRVGRLLADRAFRERMGAAGRKRAVECFSLQAMVGRYDALYRELMLSSPAEQAPEPMEETAAPTV